MHVLSSVDLAELTGLTTTKQNALRRLGLLDGLGVKTSRGWRYSATDALMLYVMARLLACGIVTAGVRKMADVLLSIDRSEAQTESGGFLLVYPGGEQEWHVAAAVPDAMQDFGIAGLVVDFGVIMAEVPARLVEMLNAQLVDA